MSVTIALEFDGTVSPDVPAYAVPGWEYVPTARVMFGTPLVVAQPVIDLLGELAANGLADIRWHTNLPQEELRALTPALGLPDWPIFAPEAEYEARGPGWKLGAVRRWLQSSAPDDRLIWVDGDLSDALEADEITVEEQADPRLFLIGPDTRCGLCPHELTLIRGLVNAPVRPVLSLQLTENHGIVETRNS